ncbi:MAG TPA: extensin family protein [Polyangia bacterium]
MALVLAVSGVVGSDVPSAPPAPAGCQTILRAAGVKLVPWPLRPEKRPGGIVCEAPEGISIRRGSGGIRYQPAARVNCAFGLRLAKFESIVQEEAKRILGSPVRAIVHLGTYNCRKMAAYPDLVSEHSFANAIDVAVFVLANGRHVVVESDWVPPAQPARSPAATFLRRLTRRLFDEQVFTVVLTPSYDRHHRNHLHLDGASYSVDGTGGPGPS